MILEARSLKLKCQQGRSPSQGPGEAASLLLLAPACGSDPGQSSIGTHVTPTSASFPLQSRGSFRCVSELLHLSPCEIRENMYVALCSWFLAQSF